MASDPNQPLGDRERVARETGARVGFGWIWIWIVIIIILVIWFGGFGWGGYGGWWWGSRTHTAVLPHNETGGIGNAQPAPAGNNAALGGGGVQILTATNKQLFVNQGFDIRNVPVQQTNNNQAFWIGANNSDTMLVVLTGNQNNAANANIQQGQRVNVTGTIERAPSAAEAKRLWSLSDNDVNRLEQQGAYVQATQVQTEQSQTQQP
jgi:hypothetical protein